MANKKTVDLVEEKAALMRRDVIEMGYAAGGRGAHFGPALSSIEIVAGLFFGIMNHDPKNPTMADRDRFVQSKGHACLAYYAALTETGYITREQMYTFKGDNSFLAGHPTRNMKYGIEVTSGSLGNGFAVACGMAKAAKIKSDDHKVYCLVGDGECNEGIIWEAAMNAAKYELDNLIAIVDRNGVQLAGTTKDIMDVDIEALWRAAGWDVVVVEGGNDASSVLEALQGMRDSSSGKPHVIIANTTKGKGISFMEGSLGWHARPMPQEFYEQAVAELENA
ncbi:MAG: transketolase [bacterium]|nr:transketolase [bacterium]